MYRINRRLRVAGVFAAAALTGIAFAAVPAYATPGPATTPTASATPAPSESGSPEPSEPGSPEPSGSSSPEPSDTGSPVPSESPSVTPTDPGPAEPGVARTAPGEVSFTAVVGQVNDLHITSAGTLVTFDDVVPVAAGEGCVADAADDTVAVCDLGSPSVSDEPIVVRLKDGNDQATNDTGYEALVFGGDGDDTITGGSGADSLVGLAGDDRLSGRGGDDHLEGGLGDDLLDGGAGHDGLYGNEGDNIVRGGEGDDEIGNELWLPDLTPGTDTLDGGPGRDFLSYGGSRIVPVHVDLTLGIGGEAGENDTLIGIEDVLGGEGDDVLIGNAEDNYLGGNRGRDLIYGLGGDDTLLAHLGEDLLDGGDNRTEPGDLCETGPNAAITVGCERVVREGAFPTPGA